MNGNYFLKSKRIGFRTWSLDDLDLAVELWSDPEVTKYAGGSFTSAQVQRRLLTERAILRLHNIQYWPIFNLQTDELIGYCGLRPHKPAAKIFEIGILLKSAYWGKGYGEEAAKIVVDYAFKKLEASSLFAVHNISNTHSKDLLMRLGFKYTHDEYSVPTDKFDPAYSLLK